MERVRDRDPVDQLGFWSATVAAVSSISFCAATLLILLGMLAPPWDVIASLAPSLLLAPAFLVLMVCVHATTPRQKKIWSRQAVAFTGVYVPLVAAAYVVEMLVVEPVVMRGEPERVALLTLTSPSSVFNAIDGLGYCFMSLATLFAAPALAGSGLQRWVRRLFVGNAILVVPIVLTYFVDRRFIYATLPWAVTVPGSTILLAVDFRRRARAACGAISSSQPFPLPLREEGIGVGVDD